MNERIEELRIQALRWSGENVNRTLYSDYEIQLKEYEKFAELFVRECMACSIWVGKNNTNTVEPMHTAQAINQRIKKHFGVAEREE